LKNSSNELLWCGVFEQPPNEHASLRLAYTANAGVASLAECRDLCEWFGVKGHRATTYHWYQEYAKYHDQDFIIEPDRIAVNEKQVQLENEEKRGCTR
jgi:putative transposase